MTGTCTISHIALQQCRPERRCRLWGFWSGELFLVNVVAVHRLDRLARSICDLLEIAERLRDTGAGLRSLGEPWADTTSPARRMVLTVFAGIAEFERALIHERTGTGRTAAMRRGVRFGRPAKLAADQVALARRLLEEGKPPARWRGCSRSIAPPSIGR